MSAISSWSDGTLKASSIIPHIDPALSGAARNVKTTYGDLAKTLQAYRNYLWAGNFTTNPWQRGTSFTGLTNVTPRTADGVVYASSGAGIVSVLKTADAPTIANAGLYTQHCLHVDVTTVDASIAAGDLYQLYFPFELSSFAPIGMGQTGARSTTLSFWVKSTKTGTFCVALSDYNTRFYVKEYTVSVTNTWEFKTVTFPGDTSTTWAGAAIIFTLAAGSNYQTAANTWATSGSFQSCTSSQVNALDSTSNDFKLALVQLEAESTATPFEALPPGVVLDRAERYLQKSFDISVTPAQGPISPDSPDTRYYGAAFALSAVAAATFGTRVAFRKRMRATPTTITTYNPGAANANWRDLTNSADRTATVSAISDTGFVVTGASGAAGAQNFIHWLASAEL